MQNTLIRSSLASLIDRRKSALTNSQSFNLASFIFPPPYQETAQYTTLIPNSSGNFDSADIYYPIVSNPNHDPLPVALFLQGALVDRSDYANFANIVASYGFVVVVPDRIRSLSNPLTGQTWTGAFPETAQIDAVLNFAAQENLDSTSPVNGILDPEQLVLLGHSFGGAVGLSAINDSCLPGLCTEPFTRPEELVAGVFFGTNLRDPITDNVIAIDNDAIPLALIQGDRDGVALPELATNTYELIQDPSKALVTVAGVNHYGITNQDNWRDPIRPTLEQTTATETIARWTAAFLLANISQERFSNSYFYNFGDLLDQNVSVISDQAFSQIETFSVNF